MIANNIKSTLALIVSLFMMATSVNALANGYYLPVHYQQPFYPQAYATAPYYYPPNAYYGYTRQPYSSRHLQAGKQGASAAAQATAEESKKLQLENTPRDVEKPTKKNESVSTQKQAFINLLLPYIQLENESILRQRQWVEKIFVQLNNGNRLTQEQHNKLEKIAKRYRLDDMKFDVIKNQQALLSRIDIIPASLTLAQAANETGWGKSRFAREANNYFGIWTYDADKGIKPKNRAKDKQHYVRRFDDAGQSVRYYMHMLNSHPAYAELRKIRQQARNQNNIISGHALAQGLEKYSARGTEYIDLIQQLIAQNQWAKLDHTETNA